MAAMLDLVIERRSVLLAILSLALCYVFYRRLRAPRLPKLPVVGEKPGEWLPLLRAKWRNAMDMKTATETAYYQYHDRACIFPIAGAQSLVHLPHAELQWLAERPENEANVIEHIKDMLQLDHTLMDPDIAHKPSHIPLISGILTRETGNLVPAVMDEIKFCVDDLWGTDEEQYRTIDVFDTTRRAVFETTNRAFVGLPLCRDSTLRDAGIAFALDIPRAATYLHLIWKPLRPLLAPLITLPNRIHTNQFFRVLRPEIRRRLRDYEARQADPETKAMEEEPRDFLQWSLKQAMTVDDPYYSKVDTLAGRVLIVTFTSIFTTSFAITHAVLDLAAGKQQYVDELREEITSVLEEHNQQWNKRSLAGMIKLDSTLRESQRMNSMAATATNRIVVRPEGIITPSGVHLPKGTVVGAPAFPVFHDAHIYEDPFTFKPFRFAEKRTISKDEGGSHLEQARQAFPTTSVDYVNFGHGKHACPGRFFAASTLKLMLAYMVLNYDFELQEKRPENTWIAVNRLPPTEATVRIKRRSAI